MPTRRQWGPHIWRSIHYIALGYVPSDDNREIYKAFYTTLWRLLPCAMCARHYQSNLLKVPDISTCLDSKDALFGWTVELHNVVNASLNKRRMSLRRARDIYDADGRVGEWVALAASVTPPVACACCVAMVALYFSKI